MCRTEFHNIAEGERGEKVQDQLSLLINLQSFDRHLIAIANEKQRLPGKLKALDERIAEATEMVRSTALELEALKKEHREMERQIGDIDSKVQKSNEKLSNIKSNKEYQAALKEIEDLHQEKQRIEDLAIEIMEKIEEFSNGQAAKKAESQEITAAVEKERDQLEKNLKELDKSLKELLVKRATLSSGIDRGLLNRYEQLLKRKGGVAVSAVMKGVCQCCHIAIPPQKFNELIRGEEMMACPHCMRIIYWGDDERYRSIGNEQSAGQG